MLLSNSLEFKQYFITQVACLLNATNVMIKPMKISQPFHIEDVKTETKHLYFLKRPSTASHKLRLVLTDGKSMVRPQLLMRVEFSLLKEFHLVQKPTFQNNLCRVWNGIQVLQNGNKSHSLDEFWEFWYKFRICLVINFSSTQMVWNA